MAENNVVDVVRELININRDGEKGYKDAAEHAKASDLQLFSASRAASALVSPVNSKQNWRGLGNKPARRNQDTSPPRCTAAGLTSNRVWEAVTTACLNPLNKERTQPRKVIRRRWHQPSRQCCRDHPRTIAGNYGSSR